MLWPQVALHWGSHQSESNIIAHHQIDAHSCLHIRYVVAGQHNDMLYVVAFTVSRWAVFAKCTHPNSVKPFTAKYSLNFIQFGMLKVVVRLRRFLRPWAGGGALGYRITTLVSYIGQRIH